MLVDAITDQMLPTDKNFLEVSMITPCPDEVETLASSVGKAKRALNEQKQLILADNGKHRWKRKLPILINSSRAACMLRRFAVISKVMTFRALTNI
jgi:hypothetical protein